MSVTIEQDLKEILDRMSQKLEILTVDMATVKTKLEGLENDVKDIKGSQKAQIWTLIGILITAVAGFLVAVGRFVISGS